MKIRSRTKLNSHCTRYFLDEHFFVDKDAPYLNNGFKYSIYESGAGEYIRTRDGKGYRIAAFRGGSYTVKEAISLAEQFSNTRKQEAK